MWTWDITQAELTHEGEHVAFGYSGGKDHPEGKNNPAMQSIHNIGPLPCGLYDIGSPVNTVTHGPYVLPLTPHPENTMYSRSGFLIHGDSVVESGNASEGCVILSPAARRTVWNSGDHLLRVVTGQ